MSIERPRLEAELLNFMRSELSSLKAEIARRSALQERALALYLAVLAFATLRLQSSDGLLLTVPAVWLAAWLASNFWVREDHEIGRLAGLIRDRVAGPAASLIGCQPDDVVPSEVSATSARLDPHTRSLHRQFLSVSLVGVPIVLTMFVLWRRLAELRRLGDPHQPHVWLALVSIVASIHLIYMLRSVPFGHVEERR